MPIGLERVADERELASRGADIVTAALAGEDRPAIVAATGATPMGMYAELVQRRASGRFDASRLHVCQLDDYVGVPRADRRSLGGWLDRSVVEPWGIDEDRVVRLDPFAADLGAACARYDERVSALGVDVAVLGLGPNGHLGFNEPPSGPEAPTRVVELTHASVASNARYWGSPDDVPRLAITAGMTVLLAARRVVLVVAGAHKAAILRAAVEGPVTVDVPASFLQQHPDAVVVADAAAAVGLGG